MGKRREMQILFSRRGHSRDALRMENTKCSKSIVSHPIASSSSSQNKVIIKTHKKTTYLNQFTRSLEFPNFVFYQTHTHNFVRFLLKYPYFLPIYMIIIFCPRPQPPPPPSPPKKNHQLPLPSSIHHQHSFFFSPVVSFMMIMIIFSFLTRGAAALFPSPKKHHHHQQDQQEFLFLLCYSHLSIPVVWW